MEPNQLQRSRVVCTCDFYKCNQRSFKNEHGDIQAGREVSNTTRSLHRKKDREALTRQVCFYSAS
jgi:hypothetical protein